MDSKSTEPGKLEGVTFVKARLVSGQGENTNAVQNGVLFKFSMAYIMSEEELAFTKPY